MNKYEVLYSVDCETTPDTAKDVNAWINALADGEFLSKFNWDEESVNEAVEALEKLNNTVFFIFDPSDMLIGSVRGFDQLIERITEISKCSPEQIISITVRIQYFSYMYLVSCQSVVQALEKLNICSTIKLLDL